MQVDTSKVWDAIQQTASDSGSVSSKMTRVIEVCSSSYPHPDWERLSELPFDQDVQKLERWISGVIQREPLPFALHGLWFGLCNPVMENGEATADVYLAGSDSYDAEDADCEWAVDASYYPEAAYSGSECLRGIYSIAYGDRCDDAASLGNDAEWSLCLAFAVFALQALLASKTPADFQSDATEIGVATGFDSGDFMPLGVLTSAGLVPRAV